MTNLKIISEHPVTMADLREDLKNIKVRDETLNFRAEKTEEYLNMFAAISKEDADKLCARLKEINISRLKDDHIVKIIDTLPESVEELKTIMSGYTVTISAENCKKIVDIVKEHLAKK